MVALFKKKEEPVVEDPKISEQFKNAVMAGSVERRKYPRVKYPTRGHCGFLPRVTHDNRDVVIIDMAIGGLSIKRGTLGMALKENEIIHFKIQFQDGSEPFMQEALFLRADDKAAYFQYPQINEALTKAFEKVFENGFRGAQARRLMEYEFPKGEELLEIFINNHLDRLAFKSQKVEITLNQKNYEFTKQGFMTNGTPATLSEVHSLYLFIANLNGLTELLEDFLADVEKRYFKEFKKLY